MFNETLLIVSTKKIMKEPVIVRCLETGLKSAERFGFGMPVAG